MISIVIAEAIRLTQNFIYGCYSLATADSLCIGVYKLAGVPQKQRRLQGQVTYTDFVNDDAYQELQNQLASINEKESTRKSKGVYYTPKDVVEFILQNSVKALYGLLNTNSISKKGCSGIPVEEFCTQKTILEPTCGAGEFLLAALSLKLNLWKSTHTELLEKDIDTIVSTIRGNDINEESLIITKIRLYLAILKNCDYRCALHAVHVINSSFTAYDFVKLPQEVNERFDLIIGNPPYVEDNKYGELSERFGNVYCNILKHSSELLTDFGVLGFVIPLSYMSTPRMEKIRSKLRSELSTQIILSYADRPDCLFNGVHQKLCILIGQKTSDQELIYTGNYQYWYNEERYQLFSRTKIVCNNHSCPDFIPKLGTSTDVAVYEKVTQSQGFETVYSLSREGNESVYLNRREAFWMKAYRHKVDDPEYKIYSFKTADEANFCYCLINSSLFWWYWISVSDCWHVSKKLNGFKMPVLDDYNEATQYATALIQRLEETKKFIGSKQAEFEYKHRECIKEIRQIDDYINGLYGLTPAESEYVKGFAFTYRTSAGVQKDDAIKVIDLFAGCGGLSLGFARAGYSIETAVEYDPVIANTYTQNHTAVNMVVSDIKNIDVSGCFKQGDADVIIGGPPCQGFSMAGARIRHGFIDDPRNYLFKHYFNVVNTILFIVVLTGAYVGMNKLPL